MDVKALKCPKCGANLQIDENVSFCSYCGSKLFFDDGAININYKTEDIGKIKEIELNKQKEKNRVRENSRIVGSKWMLNFGLIYLSIIVVCFYILSQEKKILLFFLFYFMLYVILFYKSKLQEKSLNNLVNEIQIDINSNNYEKALIKVKTLRYTANWSNEIKEKWDDIRNTLEKIIEEKMK